MKQNKEKGITIISLAITLILLVIIAGASIMTLLDGLDSIDETKEAGSNMEKTSIIEAIQGEIENLRTVKLINGNNITDEDILGIMEKFANQYSGLSYSNSKIISTKGFEISIDEVKK